MHVYENDEKVLRDDKGPSYFRRETSCQHFVNRAKDGSEQKKT